MLQRLERTKLRRLVMMLEQREWFEALCYVANRAGIALPTPRSVPRPKLCADETPEAGAIRLLACTHSLDLQGAPISLIEVLSGLARTGRYEVHLVSPQDGPLAERARRAGIAIHFATSPQEHAGGGAAYERGIETWVRLLTTVRPSMVIANSIATFHAVDAARCAGIPSIWVIREADDPVAFFSLYPRAVQRRGLACIDYPSRMVFVSREALGRWPANAVPRELIETAPDRTEIERQAKRWSRQDARRSFGLSDDDILLLTVGTLCANKGQLDELGAMELLANSQHRLMLMLVGTPAEPGGNAVVRAWRKMPAATRDAVKMIGATPDVGRCYAAADIYVCASRSEGYPRTVLEALAFGLPIVTTRANGVREAVADAHVEYFDAGSPDSLARALGRVLDSEPLRCAMRRSSTQRWERLPSHDAMIESYVRQIDAAVRAVR